MYKLKIRRILEEYDIIIMKIIWMEEKDDKGSFI